jgi:uncharacterized protein YxjI
MTVSQIRTNLLDPTITYYVLKEDWWNWGSGNIYDQKGNTIGNMHRRVLSIRAFTEVKSIDDDLLFSVERKLISIRASYVIKDRQGNMLGRTNKKILTLFRPKLWLENNKGKKILVAQGNFLGKDFQIKFPKGKPVAKVGKSDFFRDLFIGGSLFDFTDTYVIQIIDSELDKRLLLGFVIAIDNSVHDKK